jgi:hypothetical protein
MYLVMYLVAAVGFGDVLCVWYEVGEFLLRVMPRRYACLEIGLAGLRDKVT